MAESSTTPLAPKAVKSTLTPQPSPETFMPEAIGDSGTKRYGGYFTEEDQVEWRDERRVHNVETMRRTDATVKQLLNALKAPLLSTEWDIEAASDDPEHIRHKEFVKENVFGMRRTWKEFLREALSYFDFGFSVFENIWEVREGGIYLADLEPRIQSSIQRWKLSNGMRGVVQYLQTDEVTPSVAEIPMSKLFVLTNDKEGDDLTGQSVLRPAWKHFYIKDKLYRISAISAERYGVGIPVITTPPSSGEAEKAAAEEMGRNIRSNEQAFIVKPNADWVFEILVPNGNPQQQQIEQLIQHHDRMILMAALAGFLNLGADSTGSFALSKDQSSFFLKHVQDKADYFTEQFGKQAIERMVILNFGEQDKYPRLRYMPMGDIDFQEFSSALSSLVAAGLVDPDPKMKQFTHKTFGLPTITDEQVAEMEAAELEKKMDDMVNQDANDDAAMLENGDAGDESVDDENMDDPNADDPNNDVADDTDPNLEEEVDAN